MKICGTDYDLNLKALWVYLSGCKNPHCDGCHNPMLWDFNIGAEYPPIDYNIIEKIKLPIVKKVMIAGGEPLDQDLNRLEELLSDILYNSHKDIWLWTRFYEIPLNIQKYLSYVKVGEYQKDSEPYIEPLFGIKLASGNQKIIKIS